MVQVQPLSLEELLAKKKAEEEAESKVGLFPREVFLLSHFSIVNFIFLFCFSAQVSVKSRERSRGYKAQGAAGGGEEEIDGRREEEEEGVSGYG